MKYHTDTRDIEKQSQSPTDKQKEEKRKEERNVDTMWPNVGNRGGGVGWGCGGGGSGGEGGTCRETLRRCDNVTEGRPGRNTETMWVDGGR